MKLRDAINTVGLSILCTISLLEPTIAFIEQVLITRNYKEWYLFWWLYKHDWKDTIDALNTPDVAHTLAVLLSLGIAIWLFWAVYLISYQLEYTTIKKTLSTILRVLLENMWNYLLVTSLPFVAMVSTRELIYHALSTQGCMSNTSTIIADLSAYIGLLVVGYHSAHYTQQRIDELDLIAQYINLRPLEKK